MVISMSWILQISIQLKTVDLKHGVWYVWRKILRSQTAIYIYRSLSKNTRIYSVKVLKMYFLLEEIGKEMKNNCYYSVVSKLKFC